MSLLILLVQKIGQFVGTLARSVVIASAHLVNKLGAPPECVQHPDGAKQDKPVRGS